jgi:hypothetical protein
LQRTPLIEFDPEPDEKPEPVKKVGRRKRNAD